MTIPIALCSAHAAFDSLLRSLKLRTSRSPGGRGTTARIWRCSTAGAWRSWRIFGLARRCLCRRKNRRRVSARIQNHCSDSQTAWDLIGLRPWTPTNCCSQRQAALLGATRLHGIDAGHSMWLPDNSQIASGSNLTPSGAIARTRSAMTSAFTAIAGTSR